MSVTFQELSDRIVKVGDLYARVHNISRNPDWYLLKLTEELGELTAEHLLLGGRAKPNANDPGGTRDALENEAADLFGSSSYICAKMRSTSKRP
jgi:NTP pyrophosphatase (non-canonical NTP hydrolase)